MSLNHAAFADFCFQGQEVQGNRLPLTERQEYIYESRKRNLSVGEIADSLKCPAQSIRVAIKEIQSKGWDLTL